MRETLKARKPLIYRQENIHQAQGCFCLKRSPGVFDASQASLVDAVSESGRHQRHQRVLPDRSPQETYLVEYTDEKVRRLVAEELDKLGWSEAELATRAKGDARKIKIARRLRAETAVRLKWIAAQLHMGKWTHVSNLLAQAEQSGKQNTSQVFVL